MIEKTPKQINSQENISKYLIAGSLVWMFAWLAIITRFRLDQYIIDHYSNFRFNASSQRIIEASLMDITSIIIGSFVLSLGLALKSHRKGVRLFLSFMLGGIIFSIVSWFVWNFNRYNF